MILNPLRPLRPETVSSFPGRESPAAKCINGRVQLSSASVSRTRGSGLSQPYTRGAVFRGKPTSSVAEDVQAATDTDGDASTGSLNWNKQWWAVELVSNLRKDRPNRIELLGRWFVVWQGKSGDWLVMDDMCPHRLAPLSEGRIEEDGTLLCAYHAWRFNETGKCVDIPQADSESAKCKACNSSRSRVTKYPSKAFGNILWVWPDASLNSGTESENSVIPMPDFVAKAMEERAEAGIANIFTGKLAYGFDVLVENLVDPAHVTVAHHGLFGLSRYDAKPLGMKPDEPLKDVPRNYNVMSFGYEATSKKGGWAHVELNAPGAVHYRTAEYRGAEPWTGQYLYATPLGDGRSRAFAINAANKMVVEPTNPFTLMLKLLPWVSCRAFNFLFDGDMVFLNSQDEVLRRLSKETGNPGWKEYFMPTSSDRSIVAMRKWLDTDGGGGPKMPPSQVALDPRKEVLMNRYQQHGDGCPHCDKGMKLMDNLMLFAQGLGVVSLVAGVLTLNNGGVGLWKSILGTLLSFAVGRFAQKQKQKFFFVDFSHADLH